MLRRFAILSVIGLIALAHFSSAGAAESGLAPATGGPSADSIGRIDAVPWTSEGTVPGQIIPPGSGQSSPIGREAPAISGRYSIGGTTIMPFLGAGFSGGYLSDVDRSVNSALSPQADSNVRSLFGQSLVPNEFRLGIRIPF